MTSTELHDEELLDLLDRTMSRVADVAPTLPLEAAASDHRWVATAAASLLLVGGAAGLTMLNRSSDRPTEPAGAEGTATPADTTPSGGTNGAEVASSVPLSTILVPGQLSTDQVLYSGTRQGPIESDSGQPFTPWADRVYAPANGVDDPRQLIGLSLTDRAFCSADHGLAVDVNGHSGSLCSVVYGIDVLTWQVEAGALNVTAGPSTTTDLLIEFSSELDALGTLDATNAPEGWTLLSDNRTAIAAGASQTLYTIGPSTADQGLRYVELRIWSNVPDSALYAIGSPVAGEWTTIRGVPAIIDAKEPSNVFIYWADPSGVVVSLQVFGGDRDSAIAFANGMREATATEFADFLGEAQPAPFQLPRDER